MSSPPKTTKPPHRLTTFFGISIQIVLITFLARFLMDISTRMALPFIPQISTGLGLTIVGFSWLLFIRAVVGMIGPLFGMLADRYGRRQIMSLALLGEAVGVIGLALSWQWWATIPIIMTGLSVAAFIPAQQAYISDKVPYQRRGRAIAVVEFAWSSTAIIALPVVGWLIDAFGWQIPFWLLGGLALMGSALVWRRLPPVETHHSYPQLNFTESRKILFTQPVITSMGSASLIFFAATILLTIWGVWLNAAFELSASQLGWVATILGTAELGGAIAAGLFIDRIGKKRGSSFGLLVTACFLLSLPLTQTHLWLAVAGLTMLSLAYEFTIVSLLPLYSEQVPHARGTVFSLVFLGISAGSAIASPVATTLWKQAGLWADSTLAGLILIIVWWIIRNFIHDHETMPD